MTSERDEEAEACGMPWGSPIAKAAWANAILAWDGEGRVGGEAVVVVGKGNRLLGLCGNDWFSIEMEDSVRGI